MTFIEFIDGNGSRVLINPETVTSVTEPDKTTPVENQDEAVMVLRFLLWPVVLGHAAYAAIKGVGK